MEYKEGITRTCHDKKTMRKKRVFRFVTFVSETLDPLTGQGAKRKGANTEVFS